MKNYTKYSGIDYVKGLTICSTGENLNLQIGIELNQQHIIVKPKNKTALQRFDNWYKGFFNDKEKNDKEKVESIETLKTLLNNIDFFELTENYKEYLEINAKNWSELTNLPRAKHPTKPNKSFTNLKDWYFDVLEIEKTEFSKNSIDNSPEVLNKFEIDFIEKQIKKITIKFFPNPDTVYDTHYRKQIGITQTEILNNKLLVQWLNERKTELQQKKVYLNEEEANEKKIDGIKNWNKKQRTYLLLQIGIDKLGLFSELGQKMKYELIANILNCSPRKAMEYYNHCEKELLFEQKEDVKNYLKKISKEKN